jgi:protein-S-isoprenylcysteine O-methyltransferase Ste14
MGRIIVFIYGVVAYAVFFGTFLHALGFVGNVFANKSIDSGVEGPFGKALLINIVLLGLFAIPHSIMARPGVKKWWAKSLPGPVERSTYVLGASLLLELLILQWRPMPGVVWNIENAVGQTIIHALFWGGWLLVFLSTFMIDHFELFGLRQAYLYLRGREIEPTEFKTPSLYKYVRHPLNAGWLIAFWATPRMTVGHLVFAIATTAYILIAIRLEERDLVGVFGKTYEDYQQRVPMLLPAFKQKRKASIELGPLESDSSSK